MASDHHQEKQPKKVDHGVRDMVSAIMGRIPNLHKPGGVSSHHHHHEDDERGLQVVTLAGNNLGASLKNDQPGDQKPHVDGLFFGEDGQSDAMNTYVNNNFQAINNSIMMGGKYEANDPGVHLDITDLVEHNNKGKFHKHGKKGRNKKEEKEKEGSSSSDEDSDGAELREHKGHMKGARGKKKKKEGETPQQHGSVVSD